MSKTTWGIIIAAVAAVGIVVYATSRGLLTGADSTSETDTAAVATPLDENESSGPSSAEASDGDAGTGSDLQQEAKSYVEQLAEPSDKPIRMEDTEGFVSPDRPVAYGDTASGAKEKPSHGAGRTEDKVHAGRPADVTAEQDTVARQMNAGGTAAEQAIEQEPIEEAVEAESTEPAAVAHQQAPTIDLPLTEEAPITLAELIGPEETIPADAVLYVHTVKPGDDQGIWGIVHHGILDNFARGVAVHRGESTESYQVDIPRHADERREDNSSSFLGQLIHEKTRWSYVYNYETDRIGRNPDLIIPGAEIVIVSFTPEELVAIYKHFVTEEE